MFAYAKPPASAARLPVSAHAGRSYQLTPALRPQIQRKSSVSSPGDKYEREADDLADKVMRMENPAFPRSTSALVQRKCAACGDEENRTIHAKRAARSGEQEQDVAAAVLEATRPGQPLPDETRTFFEPRFGHDFSRVRVHAGSSAAAAAQAIGAEAYTIGHEIVFGAGTFEPGSNRGQRLLAHELTHVVQQGAAARIRYEGAQTAALQTPGATIGGVARPAATPDVQRKGLVESKDAIALEEAISDLSTSHSMLACGGQPLPATTQGFFETRTGFDFSAVRVHRDAESHRLNRAIHAQAFTYKNHVWLGPSTGHRPNLTLAHELAHVMQQTSHGGGTHAPTTHAAPSVQAQLLPPGNCTRIQHRFMQRDVKSWCDPPDHLRGLTGRTWRECQESDSCGQLRLKNHRNERCAHFRDRVNDTCFAGGDVGHRVAAADARRAQSNCTAIFVRKCRPQPERIPAPAPERNPEGAPERRRVPSPSPVPHPVSPIPAPQLTPGWAPNVDAVREVLRRMIDASENAYATAMQFFEQHPEVAYVLAGLAIVGAVAIVVATLAEDVVTGGAGVADDPASFAAASTLVQAARAFVARAALSSAPALAL